MLQKNKYLIDEKISCNYTSFNINIIKAKYVLSCLKENKEMNEEYLDKLNRISEFIISNDMVDFLIKQIKEVENNDN